MLGGPIIRHLDEVHEQEVVRIEYEDGRSASIRERFLTMLPNFVSFYNKWDPGMMSLKHGHKGDHVVFVLDGEVTIGDQLCKKGSHIFLMYGDRFGPWIAGPHPPWRRAWPAKRGNPPCPGRSRRPRLRRR
jgi:hypothetical protein